MTGGVGFLLKKIYKMECLFADKWFKEDGKENN